MLNLNPKSWHARLYRWTQVSWDRFMFRGNTDESDHTTTNLCLFIRALVLKLPLLVGLYLAAAYYAVFVIFLYPMSTVGGGSYLEFLLWLSIIIIGIFAAGALIGFFMKGLSKIGEVKAERDAEIEAGRRSPGMWMLLKRWVKDKHDHICTTIRITNNDA